MSGKPIHWSEDLSIFPLINRLVDQQDVSNGQLNQEVYTQSVIGLLVQAGKVAKATGHSRPTNDPCGRTNPREIFTEIEVLLNNIMILITQAGILASKEENSS